MKDLDKHGYMNQLISAIKSSMSQKGISQGKLAKMSGVSQYTIHTWVSGDAKSVNFVHALLVCKALGIMFTFDPSESEQLFFYQLTIDGNGGTLIERL